MRALLDGSVYYPACGIDGRPVQYCAGHSHSFIYVDYGISKDELTAALGFKGYQLRTGRFVDHEELVGPLPLSSDPMFYGDEDPQRYRYHWVTPFAYWGVFERLSGFGAEHGPELFSFLFLAADGVATYRHLYHRHGASPSIVAIIQPGEGFGHNWTNFYDPARPLARAVLGNPHGMPNYMLFGGIGGGPRYKEPSWPQYSRLLRFWKTPDRHFGLWEQSRMPRQPD